MQVLFEKARWNSEFGQLLRMLLKTARKQRVFLGLPHIRSIARSVVSLFSSNRRRRRGGSGVSEASSVWDPQQPKHLDGQSVKVGAVQLPPSAQDVCAPCFLP